MWYGIVPPPNRNSDIFCATNNQEFGLFGSALNLSHNAALSEFAQISSSP
jgi:hypothetical protein